MTNVRALLRERLELLRLLGALTRTGLAAFIASLVVSATLPALVAIGIGLTVAKVGDIAPGNSVASVVPALVFFSAALLLDQAAQSLLSPVRDLVASQVNGSVRRRVRRAVSARPSVDHLQDQVVQDAASLPIENAYLFNLGAGAEGQAWLMTRFLSAFLAAGVVAVASVPAAVVLLSAVIWQRAILRRHYAAAISTAAVDTVADGRAAAYWGGLATSSDGAKEVRVFDLGGWIVDRFRRHGQRPVNALSSVMAGAMPIHRRVFVLNVIGPLVTFGVLGASAVGGTISSGQLAAALGATIGVMRLLGPMGWEAYSIEAAVPLLDAVRAIERFGEEERAAALERRVAPAELLTRPPHIQFDGVSFRYPGTERYVFRDLVLEFRPGESVAVVGENGAGKTTLMRLLSGFYQPTAGRILVDGTDLAELDPVWWRRHLAVIFQDFTRFELTALENVTLAAPSEVDHERAAIAARSSGAMPIIEGLPQQWGTILSPARSDGVDLSGGQWQRLALARALYAASSGGCVLILDEPTASLDVAAELAIFRQVLQLTKGSTTVVVSHRFSTVRHADRIIVLGEGRVLEDGSHDALCSLGGIYSRLYDLQAERFVTGNHRDSGGTSRA